MIRQIFGQKRHLPKKYSSVAPMDTTEIFYDSKSPCLREKKRSNSPGALKTTQYKNPISINHLKGLDANRYFSLQTYHLLDQKLHYGFQGNSSSTKVSIQTRKNFMINFPCIFLYLLKFILYVKFTKRITIYYYSFRLKKVNYFFNSLGLFFIVRLK